MELDFTEKKKKPMQISAVFITIYFALGNSVCLQGDSYLLCHQLCFSTHTWCLNRPIRTQAVVSILASPECL